MAVAPETVTVAALRSSRRMPIHRRWEHALVALGIALPVPLLAATGLSIPLPATVERLAAALVPWAETDTLDEGETVAVGGTIVYAPGENGSSAAAPVSPAANPRAEAPVTAPSQATRGSADGSHANDKGDGGGGGSGDPGGSGGSGESGKPALPD